MEEEGEDSTPGTPFWLQSSTNHRLGRRRVSSFFFNSGLLIVLLCLTAVVSIFFIIPSIVSFTGQILGPTVRKSWDSVNIVLVLSALVFGFLSRNRNRDYDENHRNVSSPHGVTSEIQKSNPSTPRQQWYEYADRTVYSSSSAVNGGGLRRNSCSYPDLRDASPWLNADDRWRFSDDIQVEAHRYSDSDRFRRRRSWKRVYEEEGEEEQAAPVTRVEEDSYTPPPPPSPPTPPPPPPTTLHRKPKRSFESVAYREQVKGSEAAKTLAPPAATPPPPQVDSEKKSSKSDRKRSGANETKDLFTSIYNQKNNKKKKQRQKSVDNFETLIQPQAPTPPPPPPSQPPSALHNLFSSQKGKSKKIITVPPPFTTARAAKSTAIIPLKTSDSIRVVENSNSGGESPLTGCESPLIPIPPPPPPPPFKMPSWRFVVKGDYVKVGSMDSSRSASPDDSPASTPTAANGGDAAAQLFCPSPDVDTKADMFIAKFRAGLKLQKMNSMVRQKQGLGLSNLGPDAKPGPGPSQI
ncbi:uncharacterized protein LOC131335776 [Rhododendron vialii]|uniref:uncharacterized protein LOC131335776 n=1 Tax=Rhododendron vialii TaxID=182163 RepID=UPI00265E9866|nr:uncharacterized protein LOC131335776 [Rhododendron vialii]